MHEDAAHIRFEPKNGLLRHTGEVPKRRALEDGVTGHDVERLRLAASLPAEKLVCSDAGLKDAAKSVTANNLQQSRNAVLKLNE